MFDGRADRMRVAQFQIDAKSAVVLPAIEDLIADRLGQYAGGKPPDVSRLIPGTVSFRDGGQDRFRLSAYLKKRVYLAPERPGFGIAAMKIIKLETHLKRIAAKARELDAAGWNMPTEALRNAGKTRTTAKRVLLERAEKRARAAGKKPVLSHY